MDLCDGRDLAAQHIVRKATDRYTGSACPLSKSKQYVFVYLNLVVTLAEFGS